jgi:hypothetical protein
MSSSSSTESSPTSPSSIYPGWWEHVMRKKYRDPVKLKEFLDQTYSPEQYHIIVSFRVQKQVLI